MSALIALLVAAQSSPQDIKKADLPKSAICVVCTSNGEGHGEERPAAGVALNGKNYFFCNTKEVAEFKKDPEAFMPPMLPRPAVAINAKDLAGKPASLADYKGQVVLLDFWATWCAPCVKSMPALDKTYARLKEKGLVILGLSIDEDPKKVAPFLKKRPVSYPTLLDDPKEPTWAAYKVRAVPSMYLIGRDGQIVAQWRGEAKMKDVEAAIERALEAK